jgi:chorismate synthase
MPAGLGISEDEIALDLVRRQQGYGRGERMKIEQDRAQILSGVRYGRTIGSPIALMIENRDWPNWEARMRVESVAELERETPLTSPRPGHADLAGVLKYRHDDIRDVIERASARETAMRVALGAICRKLFREFGIVVGSHVLQIGVAGSAAQVAVKDAEEMSRRADGSPVRCLDSEAEKRMLKAVDDALLSHDTVGGMFEVVVTGLPVGIGSYAHYDRRLDGILAQAVMSIPAIKSVGFGMGEDVAGKVGSSVQDRIYASDGEVYRETNHAGGLEGGVSNGQPIRIRAVMKPLSTLAQPLESVDLLTGEPTVALRERSDVCAVPAASIVGEAVVLLALIGPFLEKFGGDSIEEIRAHIGSRTKSPWA